LVAIIDLLCLHIKGSSKLYKKTNLPTDLTPEPSPDVDIGLEGGVGSQYHIIDMRLLPLCLLLGLWAGPAQARVFSFKTESFAAYFRGTYGLSKLEQAPFVGGAGSNVTFSGAKTKHTGNFSGELGFLTNLGEVVSFRVGAEVLQSRVSDIIGSDSGGTKLYNLTSEVFVFNPVATLELNISTSDSFRFSVFGGVGLADVSVDNKYAFTSSGLSTLGVSSDYTEKSGALVISAHYGAQIEFAFADTSSMALELGYRYMPVKELKYKGDESTILGAVSKNDTVLNTDGSNRNLDLGGFYAALAFRFYIAFL